MFLGRGYQLPMLSWSTHKFDGIDSFFFFLKKKSSLSLVDQFFKLRGKNLAQI